MRILIVILIWSLPLFSYGMDVRLQKVVGGLDDPIYITPARDGSQTMYIIEQEGIIRVLKAGKLQKKVFLDISDRVKAGGERGLLGLAFHPKYKANGKFYVNYTTKNNGLKTRISEFGRARKERILLTVAQPYSNHNGGHIDFGPDGFLYIGFGDGGAGGDPHGNGQNKSTLLASVLRIDVNQGDPYGIPPDNPFQSSDKDRKEIWAYGIRNPWRFSFDQKTGLLYLGDVGQNHWEEINVIHPGKNYGWNPMEGAHCYPPGRKCQTSGFVLPIAEYGHDKGYSVTGGYVYRGKKIKSLDGYYIYGDYGSGRIWALKYDGKRVTDNKLLLKTKLRISSFGQDDAGEVYVVDHKGSIYILAKK